MGVLRTEKFFMKKKFLCFWIVCAVLMCLGSSSVWAADAKDDAEFLQMLHGFYSRSMMLSDDDVVDYKVFDRQGKDITNEFFGDTISLYQAGRIEDILIEYYEKYWDI